MVVALFSDRRMLAAQVLGATGISMLKDILLAQ